MCLLAGGPLLFTPGAWLRLHVFRAYNPCQALVEYCDRDPRARSRGRPGLSGNHAHILASMSWCQDGTQCRARASQEARVRLHVVVPLREWDCGRCCEAPASPVRSWLRYSKSMLLRIPVALTLSRMIQDVFQCGHGFIFQFSALMTAPFGIKFQALNVAFACRGWFGSSQSQS